MTRLAAWGSFVAIMFANFLDPMGVVSVNSSSSTCHLRAFNVETMCSLTRVLFLVSA